MYGGSVGYGLGWVMGPYKFTWQWVGLGQLFGGLGWAGSMKIDPRTTLWYGMVWYGTVWYGIARV